MTKKPDSELGALTHNPFAGLSKLKTGKAAAAVAPAGARPVGLVPAPAAPRRTARSVRLFLESKGRSGKVVTRITGLPSANLEAIAAKLRRALGCGAIVEAETVLLTGSLVERASKWLDTAGDLNAIQEEQRARPAAVPGPEPGAPIPAVRHEPDLAATKRSNIRRGQRVAVVLKADQSSGQLTEGAVQEILTSSPNHPRGIKVRLESGEVGRVQIIR